MRPRSGDMARKVCAIALLVLTSATKAKFLALFALYQLLYGLGGGDVVVFNASLDLTSIWMVQ